MPTLGRVGHKLVRLYFCTVHHHQKLFDELFALRRWFSISLLSLQNLHHGFVWHENRDALVIKQALQATAERSGHVTSRR